MAENALILGAERALWETPSTVCGSRARKALKILENIEKQSEKIIKKVFKKGLQSSYLFYILIGLVKCEEVGSYRASG
jgi:hypothetical protein